MGVSVKHTIGALALGAVLVGVAPRAEAIPLLQLDIVGGTYDTVSDTTVATSATFTLRALLTPGASATTSEINTLLADTYYISAALNPATASGGAFGTFGWNGTPYSVTADMVYGTPPLDATLGDNEGGEQLAGHGAFPSFFREFALTFSPSSTMTSYNVEPGGDSSGSGTSYFVEFTVVAALTGTNALHFDLYDSILARCGSGPPANRPLCTPLDIDLGNNAPFSHDAQSGPNTSVFPDPPPPSVPEPTSFLLISAGLGLAAMQLRRKK
jgi:hypothetical protein